jgi:hypothetical protein
MKSRTICEETFQQVYSLHLEKVLLMQKRDKRKESFTRTQSNCLTIRVVIKEQQRGITEWRLIGMEKASHMGGGIPLFWMTGNGYPQISDRWSTWKANQI